MLTDIVRRCEGTVTNRFELVAIASDRTRQLLDGARSTVDNPKRERASKVALREIVKGSLKRGESGWEVDRPGLADLFTEPAVVPKRRARQEEEE